MARAILHIGTEKTGTTAIQAYLAGNRAELREAGFIYSSLPDGENHAALAIYAQDDDRIDDMRIGAGVDTPEKLAAFRESVEQIMADEVAAAPNGVFIYSSEHCQSRLVNPSEIERLYNLLRRSFKDIVVLVYLRRQDQVAVSRHSTAMKAGNTGAKLIDPPTIDRRFYDYEALLARWSGVFGRNKMVVARYFPSTLVNGSILPDFCNRMKIPKLRQIDLRRNESLRPPHQEFLRRINERLPRFLAGGLNPRRGDIESYVSAIGSGPGRRPARATARAFYESWRASNEAVRKEYFANSETLFDENFDAYPEAEDPAALDIDDALDITADIWAALVTKQPSSRAAPAPAPRTASTAPAEPAALKALPPPGGVQRIGSGAVNAGYQRDDRAIVDYALWQLGDQQLRGPEPARDRPFFATIGAAQVFGRFVPAPFPDLIAGQIGMEALNLGMSGAGPSFFLQREAMIAAANRAEFVIVQLMSGRSVSNSRAVLANNQGVMWLRDHPDASAYYAEDIYRYLLDTLTPAELAELRAENRENYVAEMQALLARIERPKILLYWSKRPVNYREGLDNLADYWGDFPHFVNRDVVETLIPFADHYAEVVTERGIPQPLFDKETGAPIMMWPEDRFPHVHQREHNHYYPSPEMNQDAAAALMPAVRQLVSAPRPRSEPAPQPRAVLVHMHIHRNAGSAIDRALQESFDQQWRTVSAPDPAEGTEAVAQAAASETGIMALSAHQMRFPLPAREGLRFQPLLLLRNPIVRARSVYDFERSEQQRSQSDGFHTRMANQHDFRGWVEWCLSDTIASGPIANLQTRQCSVTNNGTRMEHWNHTISLRNFREASALLSTAAVGTIEDFEASLIRIERALHLDFPRLRLLAYLEDAAVDEGIDLTTTEDVVREELGDALYDRLCAANAFDLLLWKRASRGN